jgi:hypothetical protein
MDEDYRTKHATILHDGTMKHKVIFQKFKKKTNKNSNLLKIFE